jgi:hypothetical protein
VLTYDASMCFRCCDRLQRFVSPRFEDMNDMVWYNVMFLCRLLCFNVCRADGRYVAQVDGRVTEDFHGIHRPVPK